MTLSSKKLIIRAIYKEIELVKIVRIKGESNEMMGRDRLLVHDNTIETERDDSRGRDGWSNQFSLSFIMLAFSTRPDTRQYT